MSIPPEEKPLHSDIHGVGSVGGLAVGRCLAQGLLWLGTSDLEGKRSSCSKAVSLWSCAFLFPSNICFPSLFILEAAWADICSYSFHTASDTVNWTFLWTPKDYWIAKGPGMATRGAKPWSQCGKGAPWEAQHLPVWVRIMTPNGKSIGRGRWEQCLLV